MPLNCTQDFSGGPCSLFCVGVPHSKKPYWQKHENSKNVVPKIGIFALKTQNFENFYKIKLF